jgi:hypothetical protein
MPSSQLVSAAHLPLIEAWGFRPSAMGFLWVKLKKGRSPASVAPDADLFMGNGLTTRKNAEPVLLCPRGKSLRRDAGVLETHHCPRTGAQQKAR